MADHIIDDWSGMVYIKIVAVPTGSFFFHVDESVDGHGIIIQADALVMIPQEGMHVGNNLVNGIRGQVSPICAIRAGRLAN
jgi:hypothetical protein